MKSRDYILDHVITLDHMIALDHVIILDHVIVLDHMLYIRSRDHTSEHNDTMENKLTKAFDQSRDNASKIWLDGKILKPNN